ncbi:4476_t:CDS:2 [Ambispora gerdemannii]|uniref:4476_t:CDS:1 n=1 Tax=Ambispora gerdemannii TaxID=144530 RepID=A0A9N9CJR2_9GLOM|nr:4476_t:CDS:2 [Ambispora gerdemannii]
MLGAGDSKAHSLVDFRDIERAVEIGNSFLNQRFFHFEIRIKENSMLTISVNADSRWALIGLDDLVSALSFFAIDDDGLLRPSLEDKHQLKFSEVTREDYLLGKDKGGKERNRDLFKGLEQRKTHHFNYPRPAPLNP